MLPSFCHSSHLVGGGGAANILWIFCSCRLKFLGELKTFEQVKQMTGVCFPLELGIVGSRLSVQERKILFKKFFKFYQS